MISLLQGRRSAATLMLSVFGLVLASAFAAHAQETAPLRNNQTQPSPLVQANKTIKVADHV